MLRRGQAGAGLLAQLAAEPGDGQPQARRDIDDVSVRFHFLA
jgi:hypothetical protein